MGWRTPCLATSAHSYQRLNEAMILGFLVSVHVYTNVLFMVWLVPRYLFVLFCLVFAFLSILSETLLFEMAPKHCVEVLSTAFKPEKNMMCLMEKIPVQEGLCSGVSPVAVAAAFWARESRQQQQSSQDQAFVQPLLSEDMCPLSTVPTRCVQVRYANFSIRRDARLSEARAAQLEPPWLRGRQFEAGMPTAREGWI